MERNEIQKVLDELGLSVIFEFVPFSKSRNYKKDAKISDLSLNYKGHILKNGKEIAVVDYQMGIAHCPSYVRKWNGRMTISEADAIKRECETGVVVKDKLGFINQEKLGTIKKQILPDTLDFFYYVVSDCGVIYSSSFEEWAADFGFNPDSRSDERIYNECLKTALKINAANGSEGIVKLREAFEDF